MTRNAGAVETMCAFAPRFPDTARCPVKPKKHGTDSRRRWRKVHLGIDASTLEIRVMEVADSRIVEVPIPPTMLDWISVDERIASILLLNKAMRLRS